MCIDIVSILTYICDELNAMAFYLLTTIEQMFFQVVHIFNTIIIIMNSKLNKY